MGADRADEVREALEACPFCGGPGALHVDGREWWPACEDCGTIGAPRESREEAVAAWNRRALSRGTPREDAVRAVLLAHPYAGNGECGCFPRYKARGMKLNADGFDMRPEAGRVAEWVEHVLTLLPSTSSVPSPAPSEDAAPCASCGAPMQEYRRFDCRECGHGFEVAASSVPSPLAGGEAPRRAITQDDITAWFTHPSNGGESPFTLAYHAQMADFLDARVAGSDTPTGGEGAQP